MFKGYSVSIKYKDFSGEKSFEFKVKDKFYSLLACYDDIAETINLFCQKSTIYAVNFIIEEYIRENIHTPNKLALMKEFEDINHNYTVKIKVKILKD